MLFRSTEVTRLAPDEQLKELQTMHHELSQSQGDREQFFAINERFHMRVLELADNRWRMQLVADLRKVMKLNRQHSLLKTGRVQDSLNEHQSLLDALLARDAVLASQRMQAHFANGLEAAS